MSDNKINAIFFKGPEELRSWFEEHHERATELYIGLHKKGVNQTSISYDDAVTQALCFGWIDSTLRRIDDRTHAQRFTPRKKKSYWSAVNVDKAEALIADGQMHESGFRVFEDRDRSEKPKYSFEQTTEPELEPAMIEAFQANTTAWTFFNRQTASYKKRVIWWVISAKKPETKQRRLASLIAASATGKQLDN